MELLQTYEAVTEQDSMFMWIAGVVIGVALTFLHLSFQNSEFKAKYTHNMRMLIGMLAFFALLIASGTLMFSWLTKAKLGPVSLYENRIQTPYGTTEFKAIKDIYFEESVEQTWLGTNGKRSKLLMIAEKKGNGHVLSEMNYPIQQIGNELKAAISKWKQKKETVD